MSVFEMSWACIFNLTSPMCTNLNLYYRNTVVFTFLHSSLITHPLIAHLPRAPLGMRRWDTAVTKATGPLSRSASWGQRSIQSAHD